MLPRTVTHRQLPGLSGLSKGEWFSGLWDLGATPLCPTTTAATFELTSQGLLQEMTSAQGHFEGTKARDSG